MVDCLTPIRIEQEVFLFFNTHFVLSFIVFWTEQRVHTSIMTRKITLLNVLRLDAFLISFKDDVVLGRKRSIDQINNKNHFEMRFWFWFYSFRWYFILNFFIWTFFSNRVRWRISKISRRCFDEQSKCIDHRQDQRFPFPFNSYFYFTRVQHCLRSSMHCNKMIMKVKPMEINRSFSKYFLHLFFFFLLFSHYSIICWFDTRSQIVG